MNTTQIADDYELLAEWLGGRLAEVFQAQRDAVVEERPSYIDHNQVGPYAAALVALRIGAEWLKLEELVQDGRVEGELAEFYDRISEKGDRRPWGFWNEELCDLGRTRTLLSDSQAIMDGRPESGIYYWY